VLSAAAAKDLRNYLTNQGVSFADEDLICYSYDAAVSGPSPDVVVFPEHGNQVRQLVQFAHRRNIPVVPRGAGTGCSGGALNARGGILFSFEKMNHIISMDTERKIGVAEPGVVTERFQRTAEDKGLFYPPDPSSARICTLGGNVGHGAGGLRGRKYGTTRDYVAGLEAVSYDGHLLRTGYFAPGEYPDLTGLLVGSEGTLAIVVKIALRLLPLPEDVCALLFIFPRAQQALRLSQRIIGDGLLPSAMEFMDQSALNCIREHGCADLPDHNGHILLVELCGKKEQVQMESRRVEELAGIEGAAWSQRAVSAEERHRIWSIRRTLSPAMARAAARKISQDVCVPPGTTGELLHRIEDIAGRNGLSIITFGHLGDGNIHVNIMTDNSPSANRRALAAAENIYRSALSLGGTLSGEHGIGLAKAAYLPWELSQQTLEAHRKVKSAFDPKGIVNPGKIFLSS
jgi:glycolate oxidase